MRTTYLSSVVKKHPITSTNHTHDDNILRGIRLKSIRDT